jgi:hypothetical protein
VPKTTITEQKQADRSIADKLWNWRAELLWSSAAVVLLLVFVNPVLLIGVVLAVATVAAAWLGFRELLHRAERDDAESASATHLRPASASRRDREDASAHAPWHRHHAA